jgi:hypothetical protein
MVDLVIARTTPALLGAFSLITLLAHQRVQRTHLPMRQTAWYTKPRPTFLDALPVCDVVCGVMAIYRPRR